MQIILEDIRNQSRACLRRLLHIFSLLSDVALVLRTVAAFAAMLKTVMAFLNSFELLQMARMPRLDVLDELLTQTQRYEQRVP